MMAAGQAAETGAEVIILEKMKMPGRKICISGKGRCNLTNVSELRDFIDHFGKNGRFLHQPFNYFFAKELISFFAGLGLETIRERGGRVFPKSGKALEVFHVLENWLKKNKVQIITNSPVTRLLVKDNRITGVESKGKIYPCDAVIIATGGASYPRTGSSGDGFRLTAALGHRIVSPRPALVPLEIANGSSKNISQLAGLTLRNIEARLWIGGKKAGVFFGELTFMAYGISGPVVLTMSAQVVDVLRAKKKEIVNLVIDLKPAINEQKLDARLCRDFQKRCHEPLSSILRGLLPLELIDLCLKETRLDHQLGGGQVRSEQRKRIKNWLKNFSLQISGYRGFDEAIVTAGGVDLQEVNPKSMESKIIKGLYIAGELLDLNGDTGGYNLQAAFSTGWLAGRCAAGTPPA